MKYIKRDGPKSNFGTAGYTEGAPKKMFDVYNRLQPRNKKTRNSNVKIKMLLPKGTNPKPIKKEAPKPVKKAPVKPIKKAPVKPIKKAPVKPIKKSPPVKRKNNDYYPGGDRTEGAIPPGRY